MKKKKKNKGSARSARTGKYVSLEEAKRNPDSTVVERKKKDRT